MKKLLLFSAMFVCLAMVKAQTDTMYILKDGFVVSKYNVSTEIDGIIFYAEASEEGDSNTNSFYADVNNK